MLRDEDCRGTPACLPNERKARTIVSNKFKIEFNQTFIRYAHWAGTRACPYIRFDDVFFYHTTVCRLPLTIYRLS
ncbi:MAG TPA: hypothetical protein VF721_13355 [Pyrinomonadaceae bacterium]|jgi:hypothetical protein